MAGIDIPDAICLCTWLSVARAPIALHVNGVGEVLRRDRVEPLAVGREA